ncbi:MAG: WD40 repeat domain-containing protein [Planctomycetota bacterium]
MEVLALDLPELASTTQAHDGAVLELAFHPDGSSYASYGADSTVSVRLALERQRIARRPYVTDFDVDMQGEVLVLARSGQRPIEQSLLYAVETGEVLGDLPLPASCRSSACVALGPTRSFVVVAGMDGSLHVCSTREGASSLTLLPEDRDRQFCALDVSPNGALLVATAAARSTGQQEVTLWDLAELRCLARRDVPRSHVATARFSPAGELVIIAMDQKVLVYDAQLERLVLTAGTTSGVATVRPGEDEIAVATPGGQIQVISIADGSERRTSARFVTTAVQGAWSPDGNRMAVAGTGKIVIVDGDTLEPLLELPCRGTVKKLFFHEQRPWLLALTDHVKKGTVWRWDAGSAADSLTRSRDMEERVARARVLAESPADRSQSITSPLTERDQWIRDTADHLRIWRKSKSE